MYILCIIRRLTANTHKLSVSPFEESSGRASTTESFVAPEHEGWLHKQSDKYKTWNKRWFVLKGTNLFYFKSPKVTHFDLLYNKFVTLSYRMYV